MRLVKGQKPLSACTAQRSVACRRPIVAARSSNRAWEQGTQQGNVDLTFLDNIFSLIDMRSFASVWFWIVLALYWSSVSQTILGAPFDMISRARRGIESDQDDLQRMVGIHVRRRLELMRRAGHWIVALTTTMLTLVCILAFSYRLEFAQALLLLLVPMSIVRLLELRLCFRIERENPQAERLGRILMKHRFWAQCLGVIAIFVTALWGMLHVMSRSVLGL